LILSLFQNKHKSPLGMYLCVVVVTCTGIIVSKISSKPNEDTPEEKEE
jgi:hypothetical protein